MFYNRPVFIVRVEIDALLVILFIIMNCELFCVFVRDENIYMKL